MLLVANFAFRRVAEMGVIRGKLLREHNTNASMLAWGGKCWQRLSCPPYLDPTSIVEYGVLVKKLVAEMQQSVVTQQ